MNASCVLVQLFSFSQNYVFKNVLANQNRRRVKIKPPRREERKEKILLGVLCALAVQIFRNVTLKSVLELAQVAIQSGHRRLLVRQVSLGKQLVAHGSCF
jgi:hypothetical protein